MEQILTTFGIDWRLLLINAINFGLLMLGLWYFLYTPMMRMLEARREKVAQGVHDAEQAAQELAAVETTRTQTLAQAGKEADEIISHARAAGSAKNKEIVSAAEAASASILKDAEGQAKELKEKAIAESKQEVAKLVILGIEKTLAQK